MNDEYQTQQYWNNYMKKSELQKIIKEEIRKVLKEEKSVEQRIESLLDDPSLVDPKYTKYDFSIKHFPRVYKGDQKLTISIDRGTSEDLHDLSIDNFIEFLDQANLVKNPTKLKQELQKILK
jgi:hypothetical protein